MRQGGNFKRTANRFIKDRGGNFAIVFGVAASMLALAVGFGVDTAQLMNARSALRETVDAAVTSTARSITIGDITEKDAPDMVKAFLDANSGGGILSGDDIVLDRLTIDQTAKTVEVEAHVDVPLYFPVFGLPKSRRVSNVGAAIYSDKHIEVAMMLDVTGSMKGRKIEDLKDAAENAVESLLKGNKDASNPRVRVAIVPYAEAVNTGKLADTVFVEQKGGPDLPPAIDAPILVSAATRPDKCATERKMKDGSADFSDDAPDELRFNKDNKRYPAKVNRDDRISVVKDKWGKVIGTKCPAAELVALTADQQKLLDTIGDFKADGVTAGGIAAQWGYYMLSPRWRSAISNAGAGSGPADFNAKKVAKVAILMTDGQFNTAFAGVTGTPQNRQGTAARSNAEAICSNMKDAGITVFTIGFALDDQGVRKDERDQAKAVLMNCSSPDTSSIKHFYDASTGEELDAAFQEIIRNTERLALTK